MGCRGGGRCVLKCLVCLYVCKGVCGGVCSDVEVVDVLVCVGGGVRWRLWRR